MRCFVVVLGGLLVAASAASAQDSAAPEAERKVIRKVVPTYPSLARKAGISGVVRLVAIVPANGSVKSIEAIGGNPVLITAAEDAVKEWKYSPATRETRQMIELRFSP